MRLLDRLRGELAKVILGDHKGRPDCPYCGQSYDLEWFLYDFRLRWVGPYDEANEPLVQELLERAAFDWETADGSPDP